MNGIARNTDIDKCMALGARQEQAWDGGELLWDIEKCRMRIVDDVR